MTGIEEKNPPDLLHLCCTWLIFMGHELWILEWHGMAWHMNDDEMVFLLDACKYIDV